MAVFEQRAATASGALPPLAVESLSPKTATTERGPPDRQTACGHEAAPRSPDGVRARSTIIVHVFCTARVAETATKKLLFTEYDFPETVA